MCALKPLHQDLNKYCNQPGYAVYKNLESLLVKVAKMQDYGNEIVEEVHSTQLLIFGSSFHEKQEQ